MTSDLRQQIIAALFREAERLNFGMGGRPSPDFLQALTRRG